MRSAFADYASIMREAIKVSVYMNWDFNGAI